MEPAVIIVDGRAYAARTVTRAEVERATPWRQKQESWS